MPPAKLGLVYSHTGLRRFVDAIGAPRTRELFLTARNVDAATALAGGWSTGSSAAPTSRAPALDWRPRLAAGAPLAQRGNKRVIGRCSTPRATSRPMSRAELVALRGACFASEDMREGVKAFGQKRPARWQGR